MNQFLIFDENNTNVLAQELYDIDEERFNGVSRGRARSDIFNKVMRQVTFMTNALGAIIDEYGGNATESTTLKSELIACFKQISKDYIDDTVRVDYLAGDNKTSFGDNRITTTYEAGGMSITEFGDNQIITKYYDKENQLFQTTTVIFNEDGSIDTKYT